MEETVLWLAVVEVLKRLLKFCCSDILPLPWKCSSGKVETVEISGDSKIFFGNEIRTFLSFPLCLDLLILKSSSSSLSPSPAKWSITEVLGIEEPDVAGVNLVTVSWGLAIASCSYLKVSVSWSKSHLTGRSLIPKKVQILCCDLKISSDPVFAQFFLQVCYSQV